MTTTFETLLCGLPVLAVSLESHGTALVLGGLAAWLLTHGEALTENGSPLVDRAPSLPRPDGRLQKSNPKARSRRQTYSSGVLLVLGRVLIDRA
jgi:hypothetical protein